MDELTRSLAERLKRERLARDWAIAELAERSGVSAAMISKVERGEANATAVLLGRLSAAYGLTLSTLLAGVDQGAGRLARRADQPEWRDPETGYLRRSVSPRPGGPLEIIEVELPPGAKVAYPASAYVFLHHQVWLLEGELALREGGAEHRLAAGDCLEFGPPAEVMYANPGEAPCRYVVVIGRRS
jgi:transcriptional regulator with XRE-family HTH domain